MRADAISALFPELRETYASFATTILYFAIFHFNGSILPVLHLSAICLITLAGVLASAEISAARPGRSIIHVIDEVAGDC